MFIEETLQAKVNMLYPLWLPQLNFQVNIVIINITNRKLFALYYFILKNLYEPDLTL